MNRYVIFTHVAKKFLPHLNFCLKSNFNGTLSLSLSLSHPPSKVLLLEERGYLSYVDSLKEEKTYASRLRDEFEFRDLFLNAIQEHQWDFMDTLLFLDSSPHRLPDQVNALLKISQIKSYVHLENSFSHH